MLYYTLFIVYVWSKNRDKTETNNNGHWKKGEDKKKCPCTTVTLTFVPFLNFSRHKSLQNFVLQ